MRIGDAVGGRRFQDGHALRHSDGASGLAYLDVFRHGALSRTELNRPSAAVRSFFLRRERAVEDFFTDQGDRGDTHPGASLGFVHDRGVGEGAFFERDPLSRWSQSVSARQPGQTGAVRMVA